MVYVGGGYTCRVSFVYTTFKIETRGFTRLEEAFYSFPVFFSEPLQLLSLGYVEDKRDFVDVLGGLGVSVYSVPFILKCIRN